MQVITEDALLICTHVTGTIELKPMQNWVTINGRRVLVENDPEGRAIKNCPNSNPVIGIVPCTLTFAVRQGYSDFIRVDGHRVCLDTVRGLTNGSPAGEPQYYVRQPGQDFVGGSE